MSSFNVLLLDRLHDEVEIELGLMVSDLPQHDFRLHFNSRSFADEHTFKSLEHLQNMNWVHAAVLIVVAELEHDYTETNE